jgi:hypothetical protein
MYIKSTATITTVYIFQLSNEDLLLSIRNPKSRTASGIGDNDLNTSIYILAVSMLDLYRL